MFTPAIEAQEVLYVHLTHAAKASDDSPLHIWAHEVTMCGVGGSRVGDACLVFIPWTSIAWLERP
jgi:hypothetical protein